MFCTFYTVLEILLVSYSQGEGSMRKKIAVAAWAALCGCAVSAAEWRMLVEKDGATNVVTAADGRKYAIDVSVGEREGAWSGKIVNREKGAVVLGFELTAEPLEVVEGKSALYVPHVYGRRIRNWPKHGEDQVGVPMWRETADGVFVPWMSPWDVSTGSRAAPLPYPSKIATMQWATLNDGESGFYLASEDPLAGAKDIQLEYDSNLKRLKMGFFFPMFIPEGLSFDVPKVVMKEYAGTWRTAAKRYRAWWDTCRKVVRLPGSAKDFTGVFMVILKQQNGEITWPYTEFDSLGDAALAHGFRHVEFHGWGVGGHDTLYPEYDPDPAMGGREALVAGVKRLQDKGLHVSVYSNGQLQQHGGTKWYDEKGYRCAVMKRDGKPMSEHWVKFKNHPGMTFDVVCPSAPDWRAQMLKICRDAQALGFQGFFYDQIGKQWPSACFDARHGHRPGAFAYTHDRETMLLDVIGEMHKVDPDFVLWSESFNDTILDSVGFYQGLFYVKDDGYNVANRFTEGNACDMFPEMTFYVFPELVMCDRNSTSLCTRRRANGCAVTNLRVDFEVRYRADRAYVEHGEEPPPGFYDNICSKPGEISLMKSETWRENRDYLRCVSDFRRANGDLLLGGTFKADEGFSVAGGGKIVANRWDGANGEAGILVWNADDKPAAVKVSFDGNLLSVREPERGEVDADEPVPPDTLRLYRYRHVPPSVQDAARVREIQAMLRPEAGFAETRIGNREFWDRIAATGSHVSGLLKRARKVVAAPVPAPDDAKYMEYDVWTQPLQECRKNLGLLALAECVENKGAFLPKIVEYLEMFATRRCWTGRYHDRECLAFNGKIHIIELGNGQVAQDVAVVLDVLKERLPPDVRARALAALRLHCLDTYLGMARDPRVASANRCRWYRNFANWNAACNEYMVSAAIHALDDPAERAAAIELAERSIRYYLAGFTKDGLCKEGASYWSYGFGQYMRLALWVKRATGSYLSFIRPESKVMFESCYGSSYNDIGGPSFGDCNCGDYSALRHLGGQIWPEYDIYDAGGARFFGAGLSDFTLRAGEFRDPKAFFARERKPFAYPPRSWYPAEIGQLVCRPDPGAATSDSIYCAIQGGYNTRPHGHHDAGSYCIAVGGVEVMGDPGNVAYDLDTFGPKRFENPMRNSYGHPVPKVDGHLQSKGLHSRAHVLDVSFSDERDSVVYDMKDAYRTAANLVSLTRTLEYLRAKGKVVVTDRVSFAGKGAFETALITFGKITDAGNGEYVFDSADEKASARCRISVKGAKWHLAQDRLPMEAGSQFARAKKTKPLRAAIVLDEPVHEAEVTVSWSNAADGVTSVDTREGLAVHSMLTRDGRRMVSYLDGTNTVYELVPTNRLPAGLPPVR